MNKVVASADEAVADVHDGATIMFGGFGLCGIPENLIAALVRKGVKNLHTIANNVGIDGYGTGSLLDAGQIASHTGSYVGENRLLEKLVLAGTLPLKLLRKARWRSHPCGRRRDPGFLHPHRRRHPGRRRKERGIDGRQYILSAPSPPISQSSKPGKATVSATWSIARPLAISIPSWHGCPHRSRHRRLHSSIPARSIPTTSLPQASMFTAS